MSIEFGCAGVWFAYGVTRIDGIAERVQYRIAQQLDGLWSCQARFVEADAEGDPVTGFPTLRAAIRAADGFRREGYSFA